MQIVVKFPDENQGTDVQPFAESVTDDHLSVNGQKKRDEVVNALGDIKKIGYRVIGKSPLVSIEKKDGYLYVEIDEREVISVEKRD